MTDHDRRSFLKKLAKRAVYAGPVVYSLAAPIELAGQASRHHHHHMMTAAPAQPGADAPWDRPPPGQRP